MLWVLKTTVSLRHMFKLMDIKNNHIFTLKMVTQLDSNLCGCMHHHCLFFRFGPYFVEPVIAGLDPKSSQPFIASLDLIGCPMVTEDFVVSGTCSEQMYGMCETLYRPDMVRF